MLLRFGFLPPTHISTLLQGHEACWHLLESDALPLSYPAKLRLPSILTQAAKRLPTDNMVRGCAALRVNVAHVIIPSSQKKNSQPSNMAK